jgi:cholecystokinin A receptor
LSSHGGRKSHQETATTTTTMTSSSTTTTATTNLTVYSAHRRSNTTRQITQPSLRRCNAEHCLKTKRRVLKMLLVVVFEFFICWTPLYVVNTLSYFAPRALYEGLGYTGISLVQLVGSCSKYWRSTFLGRI